MLAAHYWLAYCEKLERERERLADCRYRVNQMSLGSAALAGTSIPHRPPHGRRRTRIRRHPGQQPRRLQRSRFRPRIRLLPRQHRHPPQRLGRRVDPLVHHRVQLPPAAAKVLHRLVDHAAKDQPRRAGADPRQNGPRRRQPDGSADDPERPAASLQPRLARRQRAALRFGRHRRRLPRFGRPHRRRRRT